MAAERDARGGHRASGAGANHSLSTAYFGILYQPFLPWKHAERNLREARERGFEIVVAWDNRNSRSDYERIRRMADTVVPFKSDGHCENGYAVVPRIRSEFALMLADDELASDFLWEFASHPPMAARFSVLVVPMVGVRMHKGFEGGQERLTWVDGWHWNTRIDHEGKPSTFEASATSLAPWVVLGDDMGLCIFHYLLEAPRAEREEKARRYTRIDPTGDHASRLFYEEQGPDALVDPPEYIKRHLPRRVLVG